MNYTSPSDTPHSTHKVYYGWVIVAIATFAMIASIPGQTAGVAVFTDHLMAAYKISRTQLSLSYMVGTLGSSLLLPAAGRMLDRLGGRKAILGAGVGLSLFLMTLASGEQILAFLPKGEWMAMAFGAFAFLGVRHFGQGQLTMISRTLVGRWFGPRLGFVNGLMGVLIAFAFGIAPLALLEIIDFLGWRAGMFSLTSICMAAGILGFWLFRDSPEDMGVELEKGWPHKKSGLKGAKDAPIHRVTSIHLKDAKRTPTFWFYNLALTLQGTIITAFTFHFHGLAKELNLDPKTAFGIFIPIAIGSTIANVIAGIAADKAAIKGHLIIFLATMALGTGGIAWIHEPFGYGLVAVTFGISGGLYACLIGITWPKLFGTEHLGAISGYNLGWVVLGSAVGPYAVSLIQQLDQPLHRSFQYLALAPAILLLLFILGEGVFRSPRKK